MVPRRRRRRRHHGVAVQEQRHGAEHSSWVEVVFFGKQKRMMDEWRKTVAVFPPNTSLKPQPQSRLIDDGTVKYTESCNTFMTIVGIFFEFRDLPSDREVVRTIDRNIQRNIVVVVGVLRCGQAAPFVVFPAAGKK